MTRLQLKPILSQSIRRWHKREHYPYQDQIVGAILAAVETALTGATTEIGIELPRQVGKTTAVVDAVEFIMVGSRRYFGRPLRIGIFAPQVEQATTDFERLKDQVHEIRHLGLRSKVKTDGELKIPEKWNSKAIRLYRSDGFFLAEVYIFPLARSSNPESKTLDLIIIEEAQDVDDEKMKNAVFPMGASTNAPRIYIGTAGTRKCFFKDILDAGGPNVIRIPIKEVFRQREEAAARTGDPRHMLYHRYVEHEIEREGMESDYIQRQFFSKWIIGQGQFTTAEKIDAMIAKDRKTISENRERKDPRDKDKTLPPCRVYVGIDVAKSPDRTVVTAIRQNEELGKTQLCGWLSLRGDNYEDQFDIIKDWLAQFDNIRAIAIDSTGQGDFMPDKFERKTSYNIIRFKFTAESKDGLYKLLQQVIENALTELPDVPFDEDYRRFRQELIDLQKEYKGRFMSVHHPEGAKAHDDYPDSWALAEHALAEIIKKEPTLRFL